MSTPNDPLNPPPLEDRFQQPTPQPGNIHISTSDPYATTPTEANYPRGFVKTRRFNGLKTTALLGVMWAVLLGLGGLMTSMTRTPIFIWISFFVALGMTAYSYWNSDKLAIRAMNAYPVSAQEQPTMYRIVEELAHKANQPMPRLYIAPTMAPNAFATGRNPQNAAVCCTDGILRLLDDRELRGVLGHELMHVYNRDILTASIASALAGAISTIAQMFMFMGGSSRDRGVNPLAMISTALLAPIAATLIQFAVGRTREFAADKDGAELVEDPLALASALQKLDSGTSHIQMPDDPQVVTASSLMIANPFRGRGVKQMFSTHPPMEKRIERLYEQAGISHNPNDTAPSQ